MTRQQSPRVPRRLATSELYFWELAARQRAARRLRRGEALVLAGLACGLLGAVADVFGRTAAGVVCWCVGYPAVVVGFRLVERAERALGRGGRR